MTMNILNNLGIGINPAAGVKDAAPSGGAGESGATDFAALLRDAPDDRGRAVPVRDAGNARQDDRLRENEPSGRNEQVAQGDNAARERRVTADDNNDPQPQQVDRKDNKKPIPAKNSARQGSEKAEVAETRKPSDRKIDKAEKNGDSDAGEENPDTKVADGDVTPTESVVRTLSAATEAITTIAGNMERGEIADVDGKEGKSRRIAPDALKTATNKAGKDQSMAETSNDADAAKLQASSGDDTPEISDNPAPTGSTSTGTKAGEATDLLAKLAQTIKNTADVKAPKDVAVSPVVANGEGAKVDGDTQVRLSALAERRVKLAAKADSDAAVRVQGNSNNATASVPVDAESRRGSSGQGRGEDRNTSDRLAAAMARIGATDAGASPLVGQFVLTATDGATGLTGATGINSNLSVSLGQQVIDMGVTGQWLDRISQQIASVSNGQGRGSFRLESDTMGPMRVDLTPGTNGLSVRMSVESEAAAASLARDSGRLMQDAQLSAVRIAEVRVDHVAHVGEAPRSEMGNGQQQGQSSSGNSSLANMNQNASQQRGSAAAMAGQDLGRGSSQANPKAEGGRAVSAESGMDDSSVASGNSGARRARYA